MFQWLSALFKPYTVQDLIEEMVPGHKNRMAQLDQKREEEERQWYEKEARALKRARLEQELEDAEWILQYEARLNKLRGEITTQKGKTERSGGDARRLKKLDAYFENLSRALSLD